MRCLNSHATNVIIIFFFKKAVWFGRLGGTFSRHFRVFTLISAWGFMSCTKIM
jgi:hypothetical protein